jgi:hypothetical protein
LSIEADIAAFLKGRPASFVSRFKINMNTNSIFMEIPSDRVRDKASGFHTSHRQLAILRRDLATRFHLSAIFIIRTSQELIDLEAGLRAILFRRFPGCVSDCYFSINPAGSAHIYVTVTNQCDDATANALHAAIVSFLTQANLHAESVDLVNVSETQPSIAAILRSIKALAPVTIGEISSHLSGRDFRWPSGHWLSGKLDYARKQGLLLRDKNGSYVLTAAGLDAVPHTRSRSSSDIERMLLLGRRKRW